MYLNATLPDGLDSIVTQLLANLLTKPSVFYFLPIVSCNLVSIKLLLLLLLLFRQFVISDSNSFLRQTIKTSSTLNVPLWLWDKNSANVCPCVCRKWLLIMVYKLSYITGLLYA